MTPEEQAEIARLRDENAQLRAKLDRANDPTWPLKERQVRALEAIAEEAADRPKPRNVLETISHWWCPDKSRHMRINY